MDFERFEGLKATFISGGRTRHLTWAMRVQPASSLRPALIAHRTFCGRAVAPGSELTSVSVKPGDTGFCGTCMSGFRRQVRSLERVFAPKRRRDR
jgi:hypothetical protein